MARRAKRGGSVEARKRLKAKKDLQRAIRKERARRALEHELQDKVVRRKVRHGTVSMYPEVMASAKLPDTEVSFTEKVRKALLSGKAIILPNGQPLVADDVMLQADRFSGKSKLVPVRYVRYRKGRGAAYSKAGAYELRRKAQEADPLGLEGKVVE
jgi:IS5 family transposase